ncbi:hypothetical protein [Mucilaginibacter sp.]|uniref:hypothetical protein n=1 Tax=Mucilaginibacter sp. TaxID=1882438 RepID=UPI0035BC5A32
MIIYGTRAKLLTSEIVAEPCPHCNYANVVQMNVFQKWAHIFWIPFFPIGKTGVSQCTHCAQVLQLKQMSPSLKISYDNMKGNVKTPLWTFSGLGIIALIAIVAVISERQKVEKVSKMLPHLRKGDILHIKLTEGAYTLAKVNRIQGDSVFVQFNSYQTDRSTDVESLKSKDYVVKEEALTVADLKEMDKEKQVLDVERM